MLMMLSIRNPFVLRKHQSFGTLHIQKLRLVV